MAGKPNSALSPGDRKALDGVLRKLWNLGANFIIGWRPIPNGIKLVYLPSQALTRAAKSYPDIFDPARQITADERLDALSDAGCLSSDVALPFKIPRGGVAGRQVDALLRYYTVTERRNRAVSLFDIVNFSMYSAFDQIAQLTILSHYINSAAAQCKKLEMPIDLATSTTGDGFYLWNRIDGIDADMALYCVTMLALYHNYAARQIRKTESVPHLRVSLCFGPSFEYFQATGGASGFSSYIVGDVTISLARILDRALSRQVLIGSQARELGDNDSHWRELLGASTIDTPTFVALAQSRLEKLVGLPGPGGKIAEIKSYLTGRQVSENEFSIRRYCVVDKHALEHRCFNAKFNVTNDSGDVVQVGLLNEELGAFDAEHAESGDIRVRVV